MFTSRDRASCVPRRGGVSLAISTGKLCQFCGKQSTTAFFKVARSIQNSNETSEYPLNYHHMNGRVLLSVSHSCRDEGM